MKPHQNLEAWKRSFFFVKRIYVITAKFPSEEKFGIITQIRRAAISVPANIAEGAGRKSKKEFINFLSIALGSLSELNTLILIAEELNFIDNNESKILNDELDMIGKLVYGLMKKLNQTS